MAERSVSVHLKAVVDGFRRSMGQARDSVKGVGDESEKTSRRASSSLGKLAEHARENEQAYTQVGGALVGIGAAAAAGVGLAVAKFADFDEAMSAVQAATHETTENMGLLRTAAIQAGQDTQFSATEAAGAIEELSKAGVGVTDILGGGLAGALDLAAAGTLDVSSAAEIAATTLKQFNLKGDQASHVADVLAAGAGKAQGSVEDLSGALKYAGVPAGQLGLSLEETAGTLALFASNGVIGEQAGTSFRAMLMSLTAPSKIAQGAMEDYNVTLFDANGEFVGMAAAAEELKSKLGPLSEQERQAALGRIFGNESMSAALALYAAGADGVEEWTQKVDDSGYAAETARLKTDNLRGDVERLGGSLDTALIKTGEQANGVLRGLTQRLDALVGVYSDLPPAAQGTALATAGVTAAVGLLGGGAIFAVPKLVEFYDSLGKMGAVGSRTQKTLRGVGSLLAGPWGAALAVGTAALGVWADQQLKARMYVNDLSASLDEQTGSISDSTREIVKNDLAARDGWWIFEKQSAFDAAEQLGISLEDVTEAALGNEDALERVNAQLDEWREKTQLGSEWASENKDSVVDMALAVQRVGEAVSGNNAALDEGARVTEQKAEADDHAAEAAGASAAAQDVLKASVGAGAQTTQGATDAIEELSSALSELNGAGRSAIDSQIAWEASLDEATAALKKNGATLDLTTDAGRENMRTLQNMASDAEKLGDSILRETGSEEKMRASLAASREALYQTARRFGMTEEEARAYVDRVLSVPVAAKTSVQLEGAQQAIEELNAYLRKLDDIDGSTATTYIRHVERLVRTGPRTAQADGGILAFADGGALPAIGAQQPQIQPNQGPGGIMWAETGAGPWEAFISGHPAKRERSVRIWEETGERLGVQFQRFDSGGYYGPAAAAPSSSRGPDVVSLSNTDIWKLADAVSRVQLSLNGRAIAENTQSRQDFMMRAGG